MKSTALGATITTDLHPHANGGRKPARNHAGRYPNLTSISKPSNAKDTPMTKIVNGILVIEPEDDDTCELCGKVDELRPYGPNGERICFDCGMKHEETTDAAFDKILDQVFGRRH